MKKTLIIFLLHITFSVYSQQQKIDSLFIRNIYTYALTQGKAYDWLHYISYEIGGRLSGSYSNKRMVDYTKSQLEALGVSVRLQSVVVPHWVRGLTEYAYIETPRGKTTVVPILALGGSVATPAIGIKASVVEFPDLKTLEKASIDNVVGKIVFINYKMDASVLNPFEAYKEASTSYYSVARVAVEKGAVAVIVRSLTYKLDDSPHTYAITYGNLPRSRHIPVAAISTQTADLLSTMLTLNPNTHFYFKQNCRLLEETESHNVIAEIKGSEYPDQIIVVGAHHDSWDIGKGVHDNGVGVVQAMEVLNILKKINYQPKRTIRVVLFANKENGTRGAIQYAETINKKKEKHIFALEADTGGFTPRGFYLEGVSAKIDKIKSWKNLFEPYYLHIFKEDFPGVNISLLKNNEILLSRLVTDAQRYFDYHHSEADIFETVNKREIEMGAAAMASLTYLVDKYGM